MPRAYALLVLWSERVKARHMGYLMVLVKACHASAVNVSAGPLRLVVSRTMTASADGDLYAGPSVVAE